MSASILEYLAVDHERLEHLLDEAAGGGGPIVMAAYEEFRRGLLRHIGIEERVLLPAIMRARGGRPSRDEERLRLDHGAIAALLVPPPDAAIIRTLQFILVPHNEREEGDGGIYRVLDDPEDVDTALLLEKIARVAEVPVMPFNENPEVLDATRRALARAGYELK
jgi:hypothetical protein